MKKIYWRFTLALLVLLYLLCVSVIPPKPPTIPQKVKLNAHLWWDTRRGVIMTSKEFLRLPRETRDSLGIDAGEKIKEIQENLKK